VGVGLWVCCTAWGLNKGSTEHNSFTFDFPKMLVGLLTIGATVGLTGAIRFLGIDYQIK